MYGYRGWDELERYGAGKRGRGAGAWRFSPAGERERPRQDGPGDVLAALGRQEVGRVRGRWRSDMARVLGRAGEPAAGLVVLPEG